MELLEIITQWQDIVIGAGQWILGIALLPTIRANDKPALSTSILTGSILLIFSATFFTLSMWNSALSAVVVSILWFILAIQKHRQSV